MPYSPYSNVLSTRTIKPTSVAKRFIHRPDRVPGLCGGRESALLFRHTVDVRENDQLLTLVTCVNQASPDERLIVMARKVRG
jgi:hypothetical protein